MKLLVLHGRLISRLAIAILNFVIYCALTECLAFFGVSSLMSVSGYYEIDMSVKVVASVMDQVSSTNGNNVRSWWRE